MIAALCSVIRFLRSPREFFSEKRRQRFIASLDRYQRIEEFLIRQFINSLSDEEVREAQLAYDAMGQGRHDVPVPGYPFLLEPRLCPNNPFLHGEIVGQLLTDSDILLPLCMHLNRKSNKTAGKGSEQRKNSRFHNISSRKRVVWCNYLTRRGRGRAMADIRHVLLKARLEENRKAWHEVIKEYERQHGIFANA